MSKNRGIASEAIGDDICERLFFKSPPHPWIYVGKTLSDPVGGALIYIRRRRSQKAYYSVGGALIYIRRRRAQKAYYSVGGALIYIRRRRSQKAYYSVGGALIYIRRKRSQKAYYSVGGRRRLLAYIESQPEFAIPHRILRLVSDYS